MTDGVDDKPKGSSRLVFDRRTWGLFAGGIIRIAMPLVSFGEDRRAAQVKFKGW